MATRHTRFFLVCSLSVLFVIGVAFSLLAMSVFAGARNVHQYSDLITDSRPGGYANHTFTFKMKTDIAAGGYLDFDFPAGFSVLSSSTFDVRNVELYVDGSPRTATATLSAATDQIVITTGNSGSVRYNLNTSTGIAAESDLEFRIGNHTSNARAASINFSTSTGTTTIDADVPPIQNPNTPGNQNISMTIGGSTETAYADFLVAILSPISIAGVDTTEEIPPYRFNGAPTGEVGGTTLNVEISLETDEFAVCRYSQTADTPFSSMSQTFESTGIVVHTQLVAVVPESLNTYYIRCIDDEGNFNIDDYIIAFIANPPPSGTANEEGDVEGDGTGSGNEGSGSGTGGGGNSSGAGGSGNTGGSSSGGGGSGGGSGGSSGDDDEDETGGGFESGDAPYASGDAEVIISGYAFPGSTVYALVDGAVSASRTAGNDGKYSITLDEIARGVYTFGIYAIDDNNVKSSTFSTSFTVTGGKTSSLSNINVMPTILVDPDPVDAGQTLSVTGFSLPNAAITVQNEKDGSSVSQKTFETTSDNQGEWSLEIDTSLFKEGTYKIRAKALQSGAIARETSYSNYTFYGVGQDADIGINADLNTDGKVNLTDFSILLFWWGSDGGNSNPPADINRDGSVSLTDFSIMLFNWTG